MVKETAGTSWQVLLDPSAEPEANMAADEEAARRVAESGSDRAFLRIYGWSRPAISLGRRQKPDDLPSDLLQMELPMVRRPTGGGAVVHRLDELTYAIAVPRKTLSRTSVRLSQVAPLLHRHLRDLLVESGRVSREDLCLVQAGLDAPAALCFLAPVCGDLLYRGRKVAGSALRAWREAVLIQGSIQGLPLGHDLLAGLLTHAAQNLGKDVQSGD